MRRVMLLVSVIVLASCGGRAPAPANGGKDTGATAPSSLSAPTTGGVAEWPAAVAALAPAYPGGTVQTAITGAPDGGQAAMITFVTHDTVQQVNDFYAGHARAAGLTQTATMATPDMHMVTYADAATGRSVAVQTSSKDGVAQVSLIVGKVTPSKAN